jgi:hypothetical protein
MQCSSCGRGALQDVWQIKFDWNVEIDLPAGAPLPSHVRCARCSSDDAATAWDAMCTRHVQSLVEESHFGIQIVACRCTQHFVKVFTERIDWKEGNDDQDWLVFPVSPAEVARLQACAENHLVSLVGELGRGQRFLVHSNSNSWWRNEGFMIGPHD